MRVTKWGECGILCAIYLAQRYNEPSVGAHDIAESQQLDLQYTQQVLQRLRKGGLIESSRGPRGGYRLAHEPSEVTLKDILYAAEGETFEIICDYAPLHPQTNKEFSCSTQQGCSLHEVWRELRGAIDSFLEKKTLEQLVQEDYNTTVVPKIGRTVTSNK